MPVLNFCHLKLVFFSLCSLWLKLERRDSMLLYLVRHATATPKDQDPNQGLSDSGFEEIKKVAAFLSRAGVQTDAIFHSSKVRAQQTAEVMAENLNPAKGGSQTDNLAPLDDPTIWAERLRGITEKTMLVGHLPYMEKFASLLLCGDMDKMNVTFSAAGVVCLERNNDLYSLQWMVTPEIIP